MELNPGEYQPRRHGYPGDEIAGTPNDNPRGRSIWFRTVYWFKQLIGKH